MQVVQENDAGKAELKEKTVALNALTERLKINLSSQIKNLKSSSKTRLKKEFLKAEIAAVDFF